MSSSAQGGSGGGDKPQGFSKFMRRASKVLKRASSSKGSSSGAAAAPIEPGPAPASSPKPAPVASAAAAPPTSPPAVPVAAPAVEPIMPSVPAALQQSIKDTKSITTIIIANHRLATTAAVRSALLEEKARSLFAKYGLKLEPSDWTPPVRGDAQRVEKKIRLRVRRTCHRCSTSFGAERVCKNCEHTRCKKCPRYPPKKPKDASLSAEEKGKSKGASDPIILTMPSRVTGKELSRITPVQRVRRTCHKCDTLFVGKATQCENCKHLRCPQCPRDPPKLDKYPDGYPGDLEETFPPARRELRNIRTHVRWTCHECNNLFKDTEKICRNCSHERCKKCSQEPPEEDELLDEEAVRIIEEKMKELAVTPQASASAA